MTNKYQGTPIRLSADFSMEFYKPEVNGMIYLSDEREEPTTKKTHSDLMEKSEA